MGIELNKRKLPKPLVVPWLSMEAYIESMSNAVKVACKTSVSPTSPKAYIKKRFVELIEDSVEHIEETLSKYTMYRPAIWIATEVNPLTASIRFWATYFTCADKPKQFTLKELKNSFLAPEEAIVVDGEHDLC
jgi:hypothetical protein